MTKNSKNSKKNTKTNGVKLETTIIRDREIGSTKETVYQVSKQDGKLTINDVVRLRAKFQKEAEKKYDNVLISLTKVLAGKWVSFKSETDMNEYFESKVKDPSKFYEFDLVQFFMILQ
jgi:hypothetical protein